MGGLSAWAMDHILPVTSISQLLKQILSATLNVDLSKGPGRVKDPLRPMRQGWETDVE
jgi:hypothetical protein